MPHLVVLLGAIIGVGVSVNVPPSATALERPDRLQGPSIAGPSGFVVSAANGAVIFPGQAAPGLNWSEATVVTDSRIMDTSLVTTSAEAATRPETVAWGFQDGQAALQITTKFDALDNLPMSVQTAASPFNDFGWHDWATFELQFSQPIANPILRATSVPAASHSTNRTAASIASTFGVMRASTVNGEHVPVALTDPTGTYATAYTIEDNTVFPAERSKQLPFIVGMCTPDQTVYPPEPMSSASWFLEDARRELGNPNLELITNPCGTLKVDTGGVAVTSLTMRYLLQSFRLPARSYYFNGYMPATIQSFSVDVRNAVSGSTDVLPASYGAATHVVASARLGGEIVAAYDGEYLTEAKSGSAHSSSDSGFDAVTKAELDSAFASAGPGDVVTLAVPVSGIVKDATVSGWIDFNGNGVYDESERDVTETPPGAASVELSWTVPEHYRPGDTHLRLRVGFAAEQVLAPVGMADSGEVEDHSLTLPTPPPTAFQLQLEKIVESEQDVWVRMDGSEWSILADDAGKPGAPVDAAVARAEAGLFRTRLLDVGTYWLTETVAPEGYSLLAEPVQFTIHADGTITLGSNADGAVTAADRVLTVRDVPALVLPATGGAGSQPFVAAGVMLLLLSGGLLSARLQRPDWARHMGKQLPVD